MSKADRMKVMAIHKLASAKCRPGHTLDNVTWVSKIQLKLGNLPPPEPKGKQWGRFSEPYRLWQVSFREEGLRISVNFLVKCDNSVEGLSALATGHPYGTRHLTMILTECWQLLWILLE